MSNPDGRGKRNEFNLNPFLNEKGIVLPADANPQPKRDVGSENLTLWKRSPFPLLICMNFSRPPIVPRIWEQTFKPGLEKIGKPLCRIDWQTDDWVRDLRQAASDAPSF